MVGGQRHVWAALPLEKTRYPMYRGWLGPTASMDGGGKSRLHRDSIPNRPALSFLKYIEYITVILCSVDRASLYNVVNKAKLVHNFSCYFYFFFLHISDDYVPIIRRNNCIYETLVTCHSVRMTVWYEGCPCVPSSDQYIYATLVTCHSVRMTVWYAGCPCIPNSDQYIYATLVTCHSMWMTVWYARWPCLLDNNK
jgi:hypothetical protein